MSRLKNDDLLDKVLQCYIGEQNSVLQNTPSFLSIIGRGYDEDLISRILAFILKNDVGFVANLLNIYFDTTIPLEIKSVTVFCEKPMNSGRADIFAVVTTITEEKYTLTIENKIKSGLHGTAEDSEQTETYCRFVKESYSQAKNAFFLLKPKFNGAHTRCTQFKTIYYDDIVGLITDNNYQTKDFIKHIKEYLTVAETEFIETDKIVLSNLSEYRTIMRSTENAINKFKYWLFLNVSKDIIVYNNAYDYYVHGKNDGELWKNTANTGGLTNDIIDDAQCCKFYRVDRWYKWIEQRSEQYWFYVEIKIIDDDLRKIVVQSVMKGYGKSQASIVKQFAVSEEFKKIFNPPDEFPYYVFDTVDVIAQIKDDVEPFSFEWQKQVKQIVTEQVARQIANMDKIFKSFGEFLKKQNKH